MLSPKSLFRKIFPLLAVLPGIALCLLPEAGNAAEPELLSLAQAIDQTLVHNPDLRIAALGMAAAAAAMQSAAAAPNPTLTLQTLGINPSVGIGAGALRSKSVDSTVRLDQLFERGGKRGFRIETAAHLEAAAGSDLQESRRQLRRVASAAYYALLAARDKLAITRQSFDLFDKSVRAAERRRQAGDLAQADVTRVRVDALRAQNDVTQAESDLSTARQNLLLLMGRLDGQGGQFSQSNRIEASDAWPVSLPPQFGDAHGLAFSGSEFSGTDAPDFVPDPATLLRRPDVRSARARLDAALATRKLALAARSADITVGIQAEHFPASSSNPQGSGNSYGLALQIPLFVRYTFDGEIRAADAAAEIARENLDKTMAQARSDLIIGVDQLLAAHQRMRRSDDSVLVAAKKSADAVEFAFVKGALGIMDLLDVRRTYRSAQLEALAAHVDYALSLAAWQAAISEGNLP